MGPPPAVAAVRTAVRAVLRGERSPGVVLAACSGGPDSMALAAALAHEVRHLHGLRAGAVTVDHGLQPGSAARARAVVAHLVALGLDPAESVHVRVDGPGGPEAAARRTRYGALLAAARRHGGATVLLGHTLDDQAETVLLGLARGSGARSLAGMPGRNGPFARPFLRLPRDVVRAAVSTDPARGLPWADPHNRDPSYGRARVRHRVMPVLEAELGPGVARALARTADLLRDDADALDDWAGRATAPGGDLDVTVLAALPAAVRRRVLRRAALSAGSPATDLTAAHVRSVDALVTDWRGQAWVDLPGGVRARREGGHVRLV